MDVSREAPLFMGFAVQRLVDGNFQFGKSVRTKLDQVVLLRVGPEGFNRIQFRGVCRKVFDVEFGRACQVPSHECRLVSLQMIPQQNDWPAEMPSQLLQHGDNHHLIDHAVRPQEVIATEEPPLWRDADHPDGRDLLVMLELVPQDRSMALWSPSPLDRGECQKACFVPENDHCAAAARFFLMRGQSHASQCAISASFRSRARHSGFCGVKPSVFKNVGMYFT